MPRKPINPWLDFSNQNNMSLIIDPYRFESGVIPDSELLFSSLSGSQGGWLFGRDDSFSRLGHADFVSASAIVITKMVFDIAREAGSIAGKKFKAQLWSVSGNNLGSLLCESDEVDGDDAWTKTSVDFNFSTLCNVAAGVNYHITLMMVGGDDSVNYARGYYTPSVFPGYLTSFGNTGVNTFPGTFAGTYNVQMQIWGYYN